MTKQKVAEERIVDVGRLKAWMRHTTRWRRGVRTLRYTGETRNIPNMDRYVRRVEMENAILDTFSKAFEKEKDVTGLIVHSDQGSAYMSYDYLDMLPFVGAGKLFLSS
ncbi:hypothetical protein I8J29_16465 [Paenibacillus sp. MWE-103]|uniref:Integrase-like protein n=1 Tax=Paenibacillus artemisiicola TaxID=1172618 RepID=A0ABS3WBY1_9BACL|nr:hypothetical protein [Paenibacillus artemisiicola]MBO7745803.1 hypothetical protein [Paenibacillus artemisiicola]